MKNGFPILTWHSINVLANAYEQNDPLAFETDLRLLDELGWTIISLGSALRHLQHGSLPEKSVVLTADDGSILDYANFHHPTCGWQKSLFTRLYDFSQSKCHQNHEFHLSVFVIASPKARAELDEVDYMSLGVWPDYWWFDANQSGMMAVESHSWDHNHASLQRSVQRGNHRGDFYCIETSSEAWSEIDVASDYIELLSVRRPEFFAYPYGHCSRFLKDTYFPDRGECLGLRAALGTEPKPVTEDSDRWCLPRFVFGRDWRSPKALRDLLEGLE